MKTTEIIKNKDELYSFLIDNEDEFRMFLKLISTYKELNIADSETTIFLPPTWLLPKAILEGEFLVNGYTFITK